MFVGGLSAWNETWERTISESKETYKNKYNYVAIDLPPFGFSTPSLDSNYFRDTQAKRIAKFIEEKKLDSVILVGHSYGAGPLTEYAITNPDKVEKLVLEGQYVLNLIY
jgi:pimeloyl-ACP methyl ester carboxylesterase